MARIYSLLRLLDERNDLIRRLYHGIDQFAEKKLRPVSLGHSAIEVDSVNAVNRISLWRAVDAMKEYENGRPPVVKIR